MTEAQKKRNIELAVLLGQSSTALLKLSGAVAAESRARTITPHTIGEAKAAARLSKMLIDALQLFAAENATGDAPLYHGQGN